MTGRSWAFIKCLAHLKMTGETPEVRSDKRKQREERGEREEREKWREKDRKG